MLVVVLVGLAVTALAHTLPGPFLLDVMDRCGVKDFPAAWLSHYEPSLHKAPMVYAVKLGYAVIIPFMIGGLGLQILLHLWRLMANR